MKYPVLYSYHPRDADLSPNQRASFIGTQKEIYMYIESMDLTIGLSRAEDSYMGVLTLDQQHSAGIIMVHYMGDTNSYDEDTYMPFYIDYMMLGKEADHWQSEFTYLYSWRI